MHEGASAIDLVLGGDPALYAIVWLSLVVSLGATALATTLAVPLGAALALVGFTGRAFVVVVVNAFMGLPSARKSRQNHRHPAQSQSQTQARL